MTAKRGPPLIRIPMFKGTQVKGKEMEKDFTLTFKGENPMVKTCTSYKLKDI